VPLFWLTYRRPDGPCVAVIESRDLLLARQKASLDGADRGLEFLSGHKLDQDTTRQIPASMIGRFLDDGNLQKLQRMLIKKNPPARSVRRKAATKRKLVKR
jgi:hypothetical protein